MLKEILNDKNTIHNYVPNLVWSCACPLGILACFSLLSKWPQLQDFFADWRKMESQLIFKKSEFNFKNAKKLKYFIFSSSFLIGLSAISAILWYILRRPEESFLLTYYQIIRDNIGLPFVTVFHLIYVLICIVYASFSDVIPGFIFYHASLVMGSIEMDIEKIFSELNRNNAIFRGSCTFQTRIKETFLHYEILSKLAKRVNSLFGLLMMVNHGTYLFMICTLISSTLYEMKISGIDAISYFIGFLTWCYFLVVGHLLAAQLHSAALHLRFTLASLLVRHSDQLTKKDLAVASVFVFLLQEDQLTACPLGLYNVTTSNLLTFTSLVIGYVIVLQQS